MVKLVGVVGGDMLRSGEGARECLARRQITLGIEADLKMVVALDDNCLACGPGGPEPVAEERKRAQDWDKFLKNYWSVEVSSCLQVRPEEVTASLPELVSCVGCRRSVEAVFQSLRTSAAGDKALEPLTVSSQGIVTVNREHIGEDASVANLLCSQISRLDHDLGNKTGVLNRGKMSGGRKQGRGGRCGLHSLDTKHAMTVTNWGETWDLMEAECREEAVLLPSSLVRAALDSHLKRHKFCCDCSAMVRKAFQYLLESGREPAKSAGEKCAFDDSRVNKDGSPNLWYGVSACVEDKHIHVRCHQDFISQLFILAEPDIRGSRTERHTKTIEIAQQEVIICIGLALFDRIANIRKKLDEAEQTCDLLFLILLKQLRLKLDIAADEKRGVGDIELLLAELEGEDKKKEGKTEAQKEKKRKARAKKREAKSASVEKEIEEENGKKESLIQHKRSNSGSQSNGRAKKSKGKKKCKEISQENKHCKMSCHSGIKEDDESGSIENGNEDSRSRMRSGTTDSGYWGLSLEDMLAVAEASDEDWDEEDEEPLIPEEEIRHYLERREDIMVERQQLRDDLKRRFEHLCVKGAQCCASENEL